MIAKLLHSLSIKLGYKEPIIKPIPIVETSIIDRTKLKLLLYYVSKPWISDNVYNVINTSNLTTFLNNNPVSERKYITEKHDCDNFSFELMGDVKEWFPSSSFGIVWGLTTEGNPHAWNFFINENEKVMFVEPQDDTIFSPTTEKIWIMII